MSNTEPQKSPQVGQSELTDGLGVMLPCPFCGAQPGLKNGKVKCRNISCKVQPKTAAWYVKCFEQKAIDDWNFRAASLIKNGG
jgi:hypothetical protein